MTDAFNRIHNEQKAEIESLAALSDEKIDTSDIPEILDWSGARRTNSSREDITSKAAAASSTASQFLGWAERPIDHHAKVRVLKSG